jgi:ADP-ribose pyrophosphatase YjhB (NUDIX family)
MVSILSLIAAPFWVVAGLYLQGGALCLAVLPGILSLVLGYRAMGAAVTAAAHSGSKRGGTSLVLGFLSLIISLLSSGLGMVLAGSKLGRMDGRALRVRGRAVTGEGTRDGAWAVADAPAVPVADAEARAMLAAAWETDARTEHASIAAFARLALDLIALGAPPHLVEACLNAALDEVRHAAGASSLASGYAGQPRGPGPIPEVATAPGGFVRLTLETVIDGCFGEGLAAACAREAAEGASDPVVRAHLATVARDEGRHAELAWDVLAFCLERGGTPARLATERALELCARGDLPLTESTRPLEGRLSPTRIAALGATVQRELDARARLLCGMAPSATL